MSSVDFKLSTRLVFGTGTLSQVGELARKLQFQRTLLVADQGIGKAGLTERTEQLLTLANIEVSIFDQFSINPDSAMVARGVAFAKTTDCDSIIGLGGGSSLDCAKGINLLLTNGGHISDYCGYGHAKKPLLPMIGIPTTAGTGSEAQSYAVIADTDTGLKMACGDEQLAFEIALLDPELTLSQPTSVTAAAGFDAIAHAVETSVTTRRNEVSSLFSREAFNLLNHNYEKVLSTPADVSARSAMHLGAFYAGLAIEQSMLGAAHACANPLTAQYRLTHGVALAILLPHIVRWNAVSNGELYRDLIAPTRNSYFSDSAAEHLAQRLVEMGKAGGFPANLRTAGVQQNDLEDLAEAAGQQWTGTFNPRPFSAREALEVYQCAF